MIANIDWTAHSFRLDVDLRIVWVWVEPLKLGEVALEVLPCPFVVASDGSPLVEISR